MWVACDKKKLQNKPSVKVTLQVVKRGLTQFITVWSCIIASSKKSQGNVIQIDALATILGALGLYNLRGQ